MISELNLEHVTWLKWVRYEDLRAHILSADVCLGVFGMSDKAASVIPNKVFQIASVGRYLVTRDGPAIRELFCPGAPGITLVPPGNPEALANALMQLVDRTDELRQAVFHGAVRSRIQRRAIGRSFAEQIERCSERREQS
jgi:glycosyltransferase involved in cell wall biosynthesis